MRHISAERVRMLHNIFLHPQADTTSPAGWVT
jgi:hypothetical protein